MTTAEDTQLWAVHVQGPDSVIAQPSRQAAETYVAEINQAYEVLAQRPDASEADPRWHGVVIPWDGTPQQHAEELARLAEDPDAC